MAAKASTFRIEAHVQKGLEHLSRLLKRPMNQLVNQAVKEFLRRRISEVELETESTLATLRAYRQSDPDFQGAIADAARAEAQFVREDPAEGEIVRGKLVDGRLVPAAESAPVQAEIHRLLNG